MFKTIVLACGLCWFVGGCGGVEEDDLVDNHERTRQALEDDQAEQSVTSTSSGLGRYRRPRSLPAGDELLVTWSKSD